MVETETEGGDHAGESCAVGTKQAELKDTTPRRVSPAPSLPRFQLCLALPLVSVPPAPRCAACQT